MCPIENVVKIVLKKKKNAYNPHVRLDFVIYSKFFQ